MTLWVPVLASGFVNAKQRSSTRMTTLYGFQPFTCGFGCKTAWFAPEWQDYIASSHHLWFCACKTAPLGLELQVSVGQNHICAFSCKTATLWPDLQVCWDSSHHLWFCACKAATLAHELLVSMGPSPHLWFLQAKQRLLVQNNKSVWVPDMSCHFVHVQQRA